MVDIYVIRIIKPIESHSLNLFHVERVVPCLPPSTQFFFDVILYEYGYTNDGVFIFLMLGK